MIDLRVGVEEFAAAMGAAKDDLIGDEHDQLRKMDEKSARPRKWQGTMGDTTTGFA